jgi:hypothetical protein
MDSQQLEALGKRAVACKGWRWLAGMRTDLRERVPEEDSPYDSHPDAWADAIPDLSDPATLGCLLALVREAWGNPKLCVWTDGDVSMWEVKAGLAFKKAGPIEDRHFVSFADTEPEALVAALEAANGYGINANAPA